MTTVLVAILVALFIAIARSVVAVLVAGEVKGASNELLAERARRAAALLPRELADEHESEWLAELEALADRPIRGFLFVRGLSEAARAITTDLFPELAGTSIDEVKELKEQLIDAEEFEDAAAVRDIQLSFHQGRRLPPDTAQRLARAQALVGREPRAQAWKRRRTEIRVLGLRGFTLRRIARGRALRMRRPGSGPDPIDAVLRWLGRGLQFSGPDPIDAVLRWLVARRRATRQ